MHNLLVKLIGFKATLLQGDFLVLDRWLWLSEKLTRLPKGRLIDIGCGSGSFSIGAGKLGFNALGLSWDSRNQRVASERADICQVAKRVTFEILDVRLLDCRRDFDCAFDVAICTENIEHILNDQKLIRDIAATLKPSGVLLLTTPNLFYVPIGIGDSKTSLSATEDGGHVRVGYSPDDFHKLCVGAGLIVDQIEYCSGFLSQKLTALQRCLAKVLTYYPAWALLLPFRVLPLVFDRSIAQLFRWPGYSICMVARKTN